MIALFLAIFSSWVLGQEREVSPGVYAKLYGQQSGWRIWRFEQVNGVICKMVKSPVGKPHAYPIGVANMMFGPKPFVEVYSIGGVVTWDFVGSHYGDLTAEYRLPGERFWTSARSDVDVDALDGKTVQVHVRSWEYPALNLGVADDYGTINLVGLVAALNATQTCAAS